MMTRQNPGKFEADTDSKSQSGLKRIALVTMILVGVAIMMVLLLDFIPVPDEYNPEASSCTASKNCWSNPTDCPCADNEYCSQETKNCVKPVCGNGACEIYESQQNCCTDCGCLMPGTFCNERTGTCQDKEMKLSDEEAIRIATEYFEDNGIDATEAKIGRVSAYGDKLIKIVNVPVPGSGIEAYISIGITENGEVIELPKA